MEEYTLDGEPNESVGNLHCSLGEVIISTFPNIALWCSLTWLITPYWLIVLLPNHTFLKV